MNNTKTLEVKILSNTFEVTCPENAEEQLVEAAIYLDQKMRDIKSHGRVISLERIAVMAALNMAHELLSYRQQKETYVQSVSEHIERLQNKLDEALMSSQSTD